jgi:hypothetical protein
MLVLMRSPLLARRSVAIVVGLAVYTPLMAQSLNIKTPSPLLPGENRGTIDNQVGSHYWSFKNVKGAANIVVRFTSMGLFGNPMAASIDIVLHGGDGKVFGTRSLTSKGQVAQTDWPGNFAVPGITIIEIHTTSSALVRNGGDYSITVSGPGVNFSGAHAAGPEQIVGSYTLMVCPPDLECQATRFLADGTLLTADGHKGTWKVFDPDSLIYAVVIGRDHWSLKLSPGRGLLDTSSSNIVFQAIRPH